MVSKMWISNAPYSQVAVVWAKDEAGEVKGLILERGNGRIFYSHYSWQMEFKSFGYR
jgi:alkylation response protein AidB-like acyl-CoA dehydrogenase